jgi:hypothetical protein
VTAKKIHGGGQRGDVIAYGFGKYLSLDKRLAERVT